MQIDFEKNSTIGNKLNMIIGNQTEDVLQGDRVKCIEHFESQIVTDLEDMFNS